MLKETLINDNSEWITFVVKGVEFVEVHSNGQTYSGSSSNDGQDLIDELIDHAANNALHSQMDSSIRF